MSRKGSFFSIALIILVVLCALPAAARPPIGTLEGMVINVSDGDHITVSNNGTEIEVRLYGIHAPVLTKMIRVRPWHSLPGQPFAERAFIALANKVLHKEVKLEIMRIDRHERTVGIVWVNGRNINHEMVAEGWAWARPKNKNQDYDPEFQNAEAMARGKRLGLWGQDNPQPPWEFKKMRKREERS